MFGKQSYEKRISKLEDEYLDVHMAHMRAASYRQWQKTGDRMEAITREIADLRERQAEESK